MTIMRLMLVTMLIVMVISKDWSDAKEIPILEI